MQTIAILGKMAIEWPIQTKGFFDIIAIVNFNTDMFRLECIFGRPDPIKAAIVTAFSPAAAFLLGAFTFPLMRSVAKAFSKFEHKPAQNGSDPVEELCKPITGHSPMHFTPTDIFAVASYSQYLLLLSAVRPLRIRHSPGKLVGCCGTDARMAHA